ncbi:MAG: isopentenyl-diphosphate Delta-isomerase [Clostridia bacterium]|nr:isopentenyl-diphosphate Delta-isomerase [Clostridia bacterium]
MEDRLILVDLLDKPIGEAGKQEAHQKSLLHRAFSVFLYRGDEMLIQKRAAGKYHSAGLWANTCCSHPRVGEHLEDAVCRRLWDEANIRYDKSQLIHLTSFVYRENFGELAEYELDHVFVGCYDGSYAPDPEEIEEMKWVKLDTLAEQLRCFPQRFSAWFTTAFPKVYQYIMEVEI